MYLVHSGNQKYTVYAACYIARDYLEFFDSEKKVICTFAPGKWDFVYQQETKPESVTESTHVDAVPTSDPAPCESGDCGYTES